MNDITFLFLFSGDYSYNKMGDEHVQFSGVSCSVVCFYSAIPYPNFAVLAFYVGGWVEIWLWLWILALVLVMPWELAVFVSFLSDRKRTKNGQIFIDLLKKNINIL